MSDRVFWASTSSAGLRAFGLDIAWTLQDLKAVQIFSAMPDQGEGWAEVRLIWAGNPAWASLLAREPWTDELQERYGDLARHLAKLLDVDFTTDGGTHA